MTGMWISSNNSSNCWKVSDFRKWNLTYGFHKVKVLSQSIVTSSYDLHYIRTESQLVAWSQIWRSRDHTRWCIFVGDLDCHIWSSSYTTVISAKGHNYLQYVYCVKRMRILIIYICIVASQLKWNLFYNISLVRWVMPRYIKQLRDCWTGKGIGKEKKESGRPFLLAYGGCWKERKMMFWKQIWKYAYNENIYVNYLSFFGRQEDVNTSDGMLDFLSFLQWCKRTDLHETWQKLCASVYKMLPFSERRSVERPTATINQKLVHGFIYQ